MHCLMRWASDGTGQGEFLGGGKDLCEGKPHGLKIAHEGNQSFFYHTNLYDASDQKKSAHVTKTHLNGSIVWQVRGLFGQASKTNYRPCWCATNTRVHINFRNV